MLSRKEESLSLIQSLPVSAVILTAGFPVAPSADLILVQSWSFFGPLPGPAVHPGHPVGGILSRPGVLSGIIPILQV